MSDPHRIGDLHVITDTVRQDRFDVVELARRAARGGARIVQYREKAPLTTHELVRAARAIQEALAGTEARLVVNDRVDVAAAVGAAGVHLGRHDLDPAVARRILGDAAIIGGTANSLEEAVRVAAGPVDYLGVGPVFGTRSKRNPAPTLGLEELARITAAVDQPVIAIGTITPERVGPAMAAGAAGVAVLSAVVCAPDPEGAARDFRGILDRLSGEE